VQYRIIWPDGSLHWVEAKAVFHCDGGGNTADRMLGVVIDITERKRVEQAVLAINDDLEQKVEQRTRDLQETQRQYLHVEKLSAIGKLSASIAQSSTTPFRVFSRSSKGSKKE
jgi:C4-dicarboxylate-specific signal transduction histidine kinase